MPAQTPQIFLSTRQFKLLSCSFIWKNHGSPKIASTFSIFYRSFFHLQGRFGQKIHFFVPQRAVLFPPCVADVPKTTEKR